jgi:hypothetical protein
MWGRMVARQVSSGLFWRPFQGDGRFRGIGAGYNSILAGLGMTGWQLRRRVYGCKWRRRWLRQRILNLE